MESVFEVSSLPDVPGPAAHASVLTAVVDLDVATEKLGLEQIRAVLPRAADAVIVDFSRVFVGVCGLRLVVAAVEQATRAGRPVAVVGAPSWMVKIARHLDVPVIPFHPTTAAAVDALCARAEPALAQ